MTNDEEVKKKAEENKDALAMLLIRARRDAENREMMRQIQSRKEK